MNWKKSIVQKHIRIDAMLRSGFCRRPRSVTVRRFGFSPGFTDNGQNIVSETQNVRVLSYQNVIMSESESVSEDRSYRSFMTLWLFKIACIVACLAVLYRLHFFSKSMKFSRRKGASEVDRCSLKY